MIKQNPKLKQVFYNQDYEYLREIANEMIQGYITWHELTNKKKINIINANARVGNMSLYESYFCNALSCNHSFKYIENELMKWIKENEINILCGVRDIISQNLSLCFVLLEGNYFWDTEEYWYGGGDVEEIFNRYIASEDNRKECFWSMYKEKIGYNLAGPEFFEKHLEEYLGIDVYQYPFDTKKGYSVIHKDKINIMIYQTEKVDKLEKEFADFFGFGNEFKYKRCNEASNKWYTQIYKKAKKEIRFDKEYFQRCYEGKYM